MEQELINTLSDKAQLHIAIRLMDKAIVLWNDYFKQHPKDIEKVNALIQEENRIKGGEKRIDIDFPQSVLKTIKNNLNQTSQYKYPVFKMKENKTFMNLWASCTQALTNKNWKNTLPGSQRLIYTSIWNTLAWICLRQKNNNNETHIYVAIKQLSDVLSSSKILDDQDILDIILEYQDDQRTEEEDIAWENKNQLHTLGHRDFDINEIYERIIGKSPVNDPPTGKAITQILEEMKKNGKTFWDQWEEYYNGICIIYSYNQNKKSYWRTESDALSESFSHEYPMSRQEMAKKLCEISLSDFRICGFDV